MNTTDGVGTIFTTQPLDFEVLESYILTVIAEDLADLPRTAESTINVTVLNINDHRPVFIGEGGVPIDTALRQVLEETQIPFPVLALQVCTSNNACTKHSIAGGRVTQISQGGTPARQHREGGRRGPMQISVKCKPRLTPIPAMPSPPTTPVESTMLRPANLFWKKT